MIFALPILALIAAPPSVSVVSVSQPNMYPPAKAQVLVDEITAVLAREGIAIAKADGAVIIKVDAAELRGDLAVHLIAVRDGKQIYEKTFVATKATHAVLVEEESKALAEVLRPLLRVEVPPPPEPEPEPPPLQPSLVQATAPEPDRTPAWIATVAGAALVTTGTVLWIIAKDHENRLRDGDPSIRTAEERISVRESGERAQTFAFIFAGLGAAGLGAAAVLFTVDF